MEKYRARHVAAFALFLQKERSQKALILDPVRLLFSESALPAEETATGFLHTNIQEVAWRNHEGKKTERRTIK